VAAVTHTTHLAVAHTHTIHFGLVAVTHMIPHTTQLILVVMVDTVVVMAADMAAVTVAVTVVVVVTKK
jgi:hypothetical protein